MAKECYKCKNLFGGECPAEIRMTTCDYVLLTTIESQQQTINKQREALEMAMEIILIHICEGCKGYDMCQCPTDECSPKMAIKKINKALGVDRQ